MKKNKAISTLIIDERFGVDDAYGAIGMPVYSTAAFEFESAEAMEEAFSGRSGRHTYTRISNPTVDYFERKVCAASGAKSATAVASGMAAISNVFMNIAYSGANIVTTPHLFGNTFSLFLFTLKAFGVEVRFCDLTNMHEVEKNIDGNTCAVFTEVITNPHLEVVDLKSLSGLARMKNVPLIADTTLVPWTEFRACEYGVDIEIVSSTKYISGGATSIGGLILDHANFDWANSKVLKKSAERFGSRAFAARLRGEVFRNMGACMSPQTANLQTLGLESLAVRFRRAAENCLELAEFLLHIPQVKSVNYPGLKENPFYELSTRQFGPLPGAMLTFELRDKSACFEFMNHLKLIRRATNLFDNRTLIIHPLSTIYVTLSPEYQAMVDVPDNMMRLSVGLEDVEDLKADILQALEKE